MAYETCSKKSVNAIQSVTYVIFIQPFLRIYLNTKGQLATLVEGQKLRECVQEI